MSNFICTSDKSTADKLKEQGFQLISNEKGMFTFLNNAKLNFSDAEKKKISYTNMLSI